MEPKTTQPDVKVFRETRAAVKIQRASRVMALTKRGVAAPKVQKRKSGVLGVVLTSDAMRGGHMNEDRTGRVLKRISVNDQRRARNASGEEDRIQQILLEDEFDPSRYCSAEVAEMMRGDHQRARELELSAWADMSSWSTPLDKQAIERRLAILKPAPVRKGTEFRGKRYLPQRPGTAAGMGARAARSLRRPSSAPAATRRAAPRVGAVFRLIVAAGRFAKGVHVEQDLEVEDVATSFFITSSAIGAARKARMA